MPELSLIAQVELSTWWVLLIVFVVVVLPFLLGALIARALGVKDLTVRLGIVLFTIFLGLAPFVWQSVAGWMEQRDYRERLALWEQRQERFQVSDQGLRGLKEAQPTLTIQR
jgi:hypothetical protein